MITTRQLSERVFQASVDCKLLANELDEIARLAHAANAGANSFTLTETARRLRDAERVLDIVHAYTNPR